MRRTIDKSQALDLGHRQFLNIGLPVVDKHQFTEALQCLFACGVSTRDIASVTNYRQPTVMYWKAGHIPKNRITQAGVCLWAKALAQAKSEVSHEASHGNRSQNAAGPKSVHALIQELRESCHGDHSRDADGRRSARDLIEEDWGSFPPKARGREESPKLKARKLGLRQFLIELWRDSHKAEPWLLLQLHGSQFHQDLKYLLDSGLPTRDIAWVAGVNQSTVVHWKGGRVPGDELCHLGIHLWAEALRKPAEG